MHPVLISVSRLLLAHLSSGYFDFLTDDLLSVVICRRLY
jgi:hypothetical protein